MHPNAFAYSAEKEAKAAIAVTTQVCEMSLDLDADVLITEIAPVSSLVQRFGRANRHLKRKFAVLHPYRPPGNSKPYQISDLEKAQAFLASFDTELINQYQLAVALENFARSERKASGYSTFLDSGYYAIPGSFRETEGYAVPCILDTDFEVVKALIESRQPYDGFQLNAPRKRVKHWLAQGYECHAWLPKYLSVVSGQPDRYRSDRGFINKLPEEVELE